MVLKVLEFGAGLAIVFATMADVFGSVVVPRRVDFGLNVAPKIRRLIHPVWRWGLKRAHGQAQQDLLSAFGGILLLGAVTVWLLLLLFGFSLMADVFAGDFRPPLHGFGDVVFQVGSAMVTLGINGHTARGPVAGLVLVAGVAGLAVLTISLTYILQIQSGLQLRDARILTLAVRAGSPPSGSALLQSMAEAHLRDDLRQFFHEWELWAAGMLRTHAAYPVLAYFRSIGSDIGWASALGAVLEAAALVVGVTEGDDSQGQADLMHKTGSHVAKALCELYRLKPPEPPPPSPEEIAETRARLSRAGYRVRDLESAAERFCRLRAAYAGQIQVLLEHFAVKPPDWIASPR